jgi:hypothetical protein
VGATVSDNRLDRWLDRFEDEADELEDELGSSSEPSEEELIFTMLDVYRNIRVEARNPRLFVSEAELERRALERLRWRR